MKKLLMVIPRKVWCLVTLSLLILAPPAFADTIDFEAGFVDLQPVGVVNTATNTVTFGVGVAGPTSTGFIAAVGPPQTSFVPQDTPAGGAGGSFFLTDETNGPSASLNYFLSFAQPVLNLSLDLFDYRVDGGPAIGDTATLNVFSDAARTMLVGTSTFTIPNPNPVDGNVANLSVQNPSSPILAASLTFSTGDVGTGIDNITFSTVPEPGTVLLFGSGLAGLGLWRWKKSA